MQANLTIDEIFARVCLVLHSKEFGVPETTEITPKMSLKADLNLDSLDDVELLMALEGEFNIYLPAAPDPIPVTIQNVCDLIYQHLSSEVSIQAK